MKDPIGLFTGFIIHTLITLINAKDLPFQTLLGISAVMISLALGYYLFKLARVTGKTADSSE